MSQEFSGTVTGDVAGRDVIKNISNSRLLTRSERKKLNDLVKRLEVEYGEFGAQTWKSIHDILGVDNIEHMRQEHFVPAETILKLLIQNAELREKSAASVRQEPAPDTTQMALQLDKTSQALTQTMQRNGEFATKIKNYERAYAALDTRSKKQAGEIEGLTAQLEAAAEKGRRMAAAQQSIARTRKRLAIAAIIATVMTGLAGLLGAQSYSLTRQVHAAEDRLARCEFEDQTYSVGSVLAAGFKCVSVGKGMQPQWSAIPVRQEKKPTSRKATEPKPENAEHAGSTWDFFNRETWASRSPR